MAPQRALAPKPAAAGTAASDACESVTNSPSNSSKAETKNDQEWEAQKSNFKGLYMDQDLTLRRVMELMRDRHGFSATEKQYKTRITKWRMRKNKGRKTILSEVQQLREELQSDPSKQSAQRLRSKIIRLLDPRSDNVRVNNTRPSEDAFVRDAILQVHASGSQVIARSPTAGLDDDLASKEAQEDFQHNVLEKLSDEAVATSDLRTSEDRQAGTSEDRSHEPNKKDDETSKANPLEPFTPLMSYINVPSTQPHLSVNWKGSKNSQFMQWCETTPTVDFDWNSLSLPDYHTKSKSPRGFGPSTVDIILDADSRASAGSPPSAEGNGPLEEHAPASSTPKGQEYSSRTAESRVGAHKVDSLGVHDPISPVSHTGLSEFIDWSPRPLTPETEEIPAEGHKDPSSDEEEDSTVDDDRTLIRPRRPASASMDRNGGWGGGGGGAYSSSYHSYMTKASENQRRNSSQYSSDSRHSRRQTSSYLSRSSRSNHTSYVTGHSDIETSYRSNHTSYVTGHSIETSYSRRGSYYDQRYISPHATCAIPRYNNTRVSSRSSDGGRELDRLAKDFTHNLRF